MKLSQIRKYLKKNGLILLLQKEKLKEEKITLNEVIFCHQSINENF